MADRKYSDDSVLTTLADADKINVLDVSDPTDGAGGTSKQIAYGSLKTLIAAIHPNVTLAGSYDYLTISGQVITLNAIDLAADVTGALPIANGGTGQTTAQAAFEALAANGGEIGAGISVIGSSDEVQAAIRANASQTANVFVIEDSGGTDKVYVNSDFGLRLLGDASVLARFDNNNAAEATRTVFSVSNKGGTSYTIQDTSADGSIWNTLVVAGTYQITRNGNSGADLVITGDASDYTNSELQFNGTLSFPNLPTSASGLSSGDVWNDSGTLKIV